MTEKEITARMGEILKAINLEEIGRVFRKWNRNREYFKENYGDIVEKHAGCIVAVSVGKIISVPFTDNISEAQKNFEKIEREIGKENLSDAYISYVPKPGRTLILWSEKEGEYMVLRGLFLTPLFLFVILVLFC